jgi:hypothetical protein
MRRSDYRWLRRIRQHSARRIDRCHCCAGY